MTLNDLLLLLSAVRIIEEKGASLDELCGFIYHPGSLAPAGPDMQRASEVVFLPWSMTLKRH